eukprot:superscaffoldBa00006377_g21462
MSSKQWAQRLLQLTGSCISPVPRKLTAQLLQKKRDTRQTSRMLHMKVNQCLNFQSGAFTVLIIYVALIHTCSVSSPVINMIINSSGVLQCESKGWYPEPEVFWLDGEGNLLSAGPTETVRGPDDLYTVSSRVTVGKRHNNSVTCRVQQKNISQTRETHIIVPDDFFQVQGRSGSSSSSSSSVPAIIGVIVGFILILAVVFVVWKWKQNKLKNKKHHEDEETQRVREKSDDPEQESLIKRETVDKKIKPLSNQTNDWKKEGQKLVWTRQKKRQTINQQVKKQEFLVQQREKHNKRSSLKKKGSNNRSQLEKKQ